MNNRKNLAEIKIHFVGIGGIGMSGIAELMSRFRLFEVQGSDVKVQILIY